MHRARRLAWGGPVQARGALTLLLLPGLALAQPRPPEPPASARWVDPQGQVIDPERAGLELARTPPARLPDDPLALTSEVAFRLQLIGTPSALATPVEIRTERVDGKALDRLDAPTVPFPCPAGTAAGLACRSTLPLRMALDADDRKHPASAERSLRAELGGRVVASHGGRELIVTRVVGPQTTAVGPIRWLKASLRVFLVRDRPHGAPPFGFADAMAVGLTRTQIGRANTIWGQCGVSFGPPEQAEVKLVDPPGPVMLAVGCELGLPAAGGQVSFRVEGREVTVATEEGQSPAAVARRVATALEALGYTAELSDNPRIGPGALPTSDLVVRRRGALVPIEARGPLSTDPRLRVCVGAVDLSDGLQHFNDVDAVTGTLEERTLLRSLDDGDPRTIEVVLVPSFSTGGRIGESFIASDRGSLGNTILEDRAGIRADILSFAMAHELGHVLLDVPGHSDDYGVDTPTRLMDSDAADPSAFGPRRLTVAECERMVRQSGPRAPSPLLVPWSPTPAPRPVRRR